jgi:hypothetical protein
MTFLVNEGVKPEDIYRRLQGEYGDETLGRSKRRRRLRVVSGATAPGPAREGVPRFRPKLVHKQEKKFMDNEKKYSCAKSRKLML